MRRHSKTANQPNQATFSDSHDILMNAPIGVLTSTPDGRYIAVNHATAEMLGYDSPEELIKSVTDIAAQIYADPSDRDRFKRVMEEHGEVVNDEYRFRRRDGQEFLASISARALRDNSSKIIAYQVFYQDITKRKQAEEALQESEEQFHSLFDSMKELVVLHEMVFDEHGEAVNYKIIDCNPAFTATTGIKREDALGKLATDLYGTETAPYLSEYARVVLEGEPHSFTTCFASKGKYFEVNVVTPKKNYFATIASNITERKRAEKRLEEEFSLRNALLDNIPNCVALIVKKDTREIVASNRAGHEIGAVPGKTCFQTCALRNDPCPFCRANELWKSGQLQQIEVEYRGTWYNGVWAPLSNDLFVHYIFDITARKRAEEEVRLINQQLEKANAEKDKFFAIIAHDLRSPFIGFLSFIRLMVRHIESMSQEDIRKLAVDMKGSAENLYNLLNNLLDWARMQRGIIPFEPRPQPLSTLIRDTLQLIEPSARQKAIVVRCSVPEHISILADHPMLSTVIRNLLFNAVKFTRRDGEISITAEQDEGAVRFSIRDTGVGMDEAILCGLFALDRRTCLRGTEGERGSGLGLILCKEFVEKHGGKIWVESEPGKGTKVFFTLPAAS